MVSVNQMIGIILAVQPLRLLAAIVLWLFYFYPIVYYGIDRKITEKGAITSMHELGVVFHIIDDLKEVAANNEISEITKVVLELGEVSTVIDSYLTDCWKWAVKKEDLLKNSELVIEKINAVTYCEDCKAEYETVKYGKICPECGSTHTYLLQGSEFNIKEIEAC